MFNAWIASGLQTAELALEAQRVVDLRLRRLAGGGAAGIAEAHLMVTDKMAAVTEAQLAAVMTILTGNGHNAGKKMLHVYRRRVRANRRRLSRR